MTRRRCSSIRCARESCSGSVGDGVLDEAPGGCGGVTEEDPAVGVTEEDPGGSGGVVDEACGCGGVAEEAPRGCGGVTEEDPGGSGGVVDEAAAEAPCAARGVVAEAACGCGGVADADEAPGGCGGLAAEAPFGCGGDAVDTPLGSGGYVMEGTFGSAGDVDDAPCAAACRRCSCMRMARASSVVGDGVEAEAHGVGVMAAALCDFAACACTSCGPPVDGDVMPEPAPASTIGVVYATAPPAARAAALRAESMVSGSDPSMRGVVMSKTSGPSADLGETCGCDAPPDFGATPAAGGSLGRPSLGTKGASLGTIGA